MRSVVETEAIVYAQGQREYVGGLALENAGFGRFTLRVEIAHERDTGDAGAVVSERLHKDRTFFVIPLWFAIAVILGVGFPLLWLSWRASVNSAARKQVAREQVRSEKRQRLAEEREQSL